MKTQIENFIQQLFSKTFLTPKTQVAMNTRNNNNSPLFQNNNNKQFSNSLTPNSFSTMKTQSIFSARQFFAIALTVIGLFIFQSAQAVETICKRTMCGHTYTSTGDRPNVLTGETQKIRVFVKFGDLVGSASAGVAGVSTSIGSKHSGGFGDFDGCNTWVDVNITVTSGATAQDGVTISLFGVANTLTASFKIDIRKKPTISTLTIKEGAATPSFLVAGRTYQLTIGGTSVNKLELSDSKVESASVNAGGSATSRTFTIVFKTTTQANITSINFAENHTFCNHLITKTISSITLYPRPDLIPNALTGKYTLQSNASCGGSLGKVGSDNATLGSVKNAIGTPSVNQAVITKEITWPNVTWSVKNTGGPVTGTFKVQLKSGNTVLQEQTITNINAGETKSFTYTRPKSKKKLMRMLSCNNGNDVHAHQDNASVAIYNWADPSTFTIAVDTQNTVTESSENNNSSGF